MKSLKTNEVHVQFNNKGETSNSRDNWNHLKIIKKVSQQDPRKAFIQVTTENSHTVHCIHTAGSTDVKVQNIQQRK
jgi:hypothetical protein